MTDSGAPSASAHLANDLANSILDAIHGVARDVAELRQIQNEHGAEIVLLRRAVHGSSSPPPGADAPPRPPSLPDVARQASSAAVDVQELRNEVRAGFDAVNTELAAQSKAAGIGLRGLTWLGSKDGRTTVMRIVTLAGSCYAALHAAGMLR